MNLFTPMFELWEHFLWALVILQYKLYLAVTSLFLFLPFSDRSAEWRGLVLSLGHSSAWTNFRNIDRTCPHSLCPTWAGSRKCPLYGNLEEAVQPKGSWVSVGSFLSVVLGSHDWESFLGTWVNSPPVCTCLGQASFCTRGFPKTTLILSCHLQGCH